MFFSGKENSEFSFYYIKKVVFFSYGFIAFLLIILFLLKKKKRNTFIMEDMKRALLDFVKFQNAHQLQLQERIETQQLQLQERMEKITYSNFKRKSREK